ncbi:MAG: hypothetical protein HF981_24835 [Desulfobacteraceae bacterium]|nr:hypothetical protein [Desulfobacteraceae bacterium]MBC2753643.1 hypothetical protein [Desulfobacteraceae bacterium]
MTTAIATPNAFEWYPFNTPDRSGQEIQASQSLRLAAVSEVSKDITLHTREGDTVTLSMDRETVAVYGRDARIAIDQQYAVNADGDPFAHERVAAETREWFGFEASQEISVTVEGDLSREEMRDIRKALRRIDRLIANSFGPEAAGRQGHGSAGLSRLDTLAGIEVDVRQSRTILAAQSSSIATLSYGTDGQATESLVQPEEPAVPAWQAVADEATVIVEETDIEPERFVDPLRDLFSHWARKMKHRRSPFHPMLKMMEARVMGRLPSPEENGLHQR